MKMTIGDVAKLAHVSPSTVSLVLNNKADGRISAENQKKIRAIIKKYNYKPNFSAQRLRQPSIPLIGLLMPAPSSEFEAAMIGALQLILQRKGCLSIFGIWDTFSVPQPDLLESLIRHDVTGIISWEMNGVQSTNDVPTVFFSQRRKGSNSVLINYEESIRQALDYLQELGHTNIGFVGLDGDPRSLSFAKEMNARNLLTSKTWTFPIRAIQSHGITAMEELLKRPPQQRPTAIITHNDCLARAMCFSAHKHGLNIPRDLSIISFDDDRDSAIASPPLTTFKLPVDMIANALIDQVMNKIQHPEYPDCIVTITPELKLRESCCPPRQR